MAYYEKNILATSIG